MTVLVGTSIREFSGDIPKYRARINAEFLPFLDWLRAKGTDIPSGGYMSHFEPGAAVQLAADLLNGFGRVLGNAFLIFLTIALDSRPDTHWIAVLLGPEGAAAEELAARGSEPESGT